MYVDVNIKGKFAKLSAGFASEKTFYRNLRYGDV
jgi:hypothetical protein